MIPNILAYPEYGFPHWYLQAQISNLSYSEWRAIRSFRVTFRVSFRSYRIGTLAGERASPWWPAGCSKLVSKDLLANGGRSVRFA